MLKKMMTLFAAALAVGAVVGSTSSASAHARHYGSAGCCGPVAPIYVHHTSLKVVNKYVHRVVDKTVHFVRPRQIYHVDHVHVLTNVHVFTDTHVTRVGHIVDYHHYSTIVSRSTHYIYSGKTTVTCVCGPRRRHC